MKRIMLLGVCLSGMVMASCSNDDDLSQAEGKQESSEKPEDQAVRKEAFLKEISMLEEEAINATYQVLNKTKADNLIAQYAAFANQFPDDEQADSYLFKAATVAYSVSQFQAKNGKNNPGYCTKAAAMAQRVIDNYPQSGHRRGAYELLTTIYDFELEKDDRAVELYKRFMEEFPNDSSIRHTCELRIKYPHVTLEDIVHGNVPDDYR